MLSKDALQGLLQTLIKCYTKVYASKASQSYYVGVNLAYMLTLAETIFPKNSEIVDGYSVAKIAKEVQHAIIKAKDAASEEEQYYAAMSEIEFQLLQGKRGVVQELEYLLEVLQPSQKLIDQTHRQMGLFFVNVVEKFAAHTPKNLQEFKTCLSVFDAYSNTKQTR